MGAHTGTHMDAPLHFLRNSREHGTDAHRCDGGAGARDSASADRTAIRRAELLPHAIQPGERILFRTGNSERDWGNLPFNEDFIFIASDAAEYLAECGVRSVGVDYLSVGGFRQDAVETHEALARTTASGSWKGWC